MKRSVKIAFFIKAGVTIVIFAFTIVMLSAVWGDKLFYMNATRGHLYAACYRWFGLVSILLIIFWMRLAIRYRKMIAGLFARVGVRKNKSAKIPVNEVQYCTNCGAKILDHAMFCGSCGFKIEEIGS